MKHFKMWFVIPMYWIIFVIYTVFLDQISLCFYHRDIHDITQYIDGRVKYDYGPCCLSITIFFVLLILGITLVIMNAVKKTSKHVKMKAISVAGILVLSFVVQFFMFLSHFSIYFLFGIVLP